MSIKKLFENPADNNRLSATNKRNTFKEAESADNVAESRANQERFVANIDYSDPANFVTYGSARLYYKSALTRISDYYPYDGSRYEKNKFLNESLDIEKYILDNLYPSSTGYAILARDGYSVSSVSADGYGVPTSNEFIDFKGGPGTGSAASLLMKDLMPNPNNSKNKNSNIYDENIYRTAGLPNDYGKGTRTSNLRANFDDGVTVEFWMKTGSIHSETVTNKQVIFDMWNGETDADSGRIMLELTSTVSHAREPSSYTLSTTERKQRPFIITVQSGAHTTKDFFALGDSTVQENMGDWNHYAIRMCNTGSNFRTELYVNGHLNDTAVRMPYDLASTIKPSNDGADGWLSSSAGQERAWPFARESNYSSSDNLQGWWRLNKIAPAEPTGREFEDSSGHGRHGTSTGSFPSYAGLGGPSRYIDGGTNVALNFDSHDEKIDIGNSALWDSIIGREAESGGSEKMTFSAWIRPNTLGGSNVGRILDFADSDLALYMKSGTGGTWDIRFYTKWGGSSIVVWEAEIEQPFDFWAHIALTYDASSPDNDAQFYLNGKKVTTTLQSARPGSGVEWNGIQGNPCYIGSRYGHSFDFDGQIADVAVWNSILGVNEIASIYSAYLIKTATNTIDEFNAKNMKGRIGALQTPPTYCSASAGAGRLSGSLDEFRYWKTKRSPKQIGNNWFSQIGGGSNSDIHNAELGLYFKFNEGITGDSTTDSIVLDYSGRASNGVWTGYAANSRNTGSAIVSASAAHKEFEDPIIRTNHPKYITLHDNLQQTGSSYDYNNNASLISLTPGWVQDLEEENENSDLRYITHVMGAYFDKLKLQISEVPKIKLASYPSSSHKPYPIAEHLPQSLGLYMPELFIDSSITEKFLNKNENELFENNLEDTKNIIYQNLYNNLADIYKSKGTEKAVRNVLRCFNLNDDTISFKIHSDNEEFILRNNLVQRLTNKNFINFNTVNNSKAIVYNRSASLPDNLFVPWDSGSVVGQVTGRDPQKAYGLTYEANLLFPSFTNKYTTFVRDDNYDKVSLFGFVHTD